MGSSSRNVALGTLRFPANRAVGDRMARTIGNSDGAWFDPSLPLRFVEGEPPHLFRQATHEAQPTKRHRHARTSYRADHEADGHDPTGRPQAPFGRPPYWCARSTRSRTGGSYCSELTVYRSDYVGVTMGQLQMKTLGQFWKDVKKQRSQIVATLHESRRFAAL